MSETRRPDDSWEWPEPSPTAPTPAEHPAGAGAVPPHPPTAVGVMDPQPPEPPAPKKKINNRWWAIGFFTPIVAWVIAGIWVSAASADGTAGWLATAGGVALTFGPLVLALYALMLGRSKGDARWRSFGIGAIWMYVGMTLLGLLLFGACWITFNGWGK